LFLNSYFHRTVDQTSISKLEKIIFEHFKITSRFGMLYHLYENFSKAFYASITKKLAMAANEGDEICLEIFTSAGKALGDHVNALAPSVTKSMMESEGGLKIVCVGSVWKSWQLLEKGFVSALQQSEHITEASLVELAVGMAAGASYLGAAAVDFHLPRDYSKNVRQFFNYKKEQ